MVIHRRTVIDSEPRLIAVLPNKAFESGAFRAPLNAALDPHARGLDTTGER